MLLFWSTQALSAPTSLLYGTGLTRLMRMEGRIVIQDVLVVYKKNFEEVHDQALDAIRSELDALVAESDTLT